MQAAPVTYRHATTDDASAIAAYHVRCWETAYRGLIDDKIIDSMDVDTIAGRWADVLPDDGVDDLDVGYHPDRTMTVVACDGDVPIGHTVIGPERDGERGELYALYVDPDHQGRGIGTMLLAVATRLLRRNGHEEAVLWTIPGNDPAIALYEAHGWTLDGGRKTMPTVNVDAEITEIRMVRSLADPDHVTANRTHWNREAAGYATWAPRAWQAEPSWGIFSNPESEVGVLADVAGADVVELGCGTGYVSAWCRRAGARSVVAVDNSPAQLATAAQLQREIGPTFPLVLADAERAPLASASFDLAVSEYGAALWCDPERWIPEAARLLRPGGTLAFLTNSVVCVLTADDFEPGTAGRRLQRAQRGLNRMAWPDTDGIEFHLPHGDMLRLLRRSGFEVVDLVELHAPPDASSNEVTFVTPEWATHWPHEEVWIARRR